MTYAEHKTGFIIPIIVYMTLRTSVNDFRVSAAVIYDEISDDQLIIYSESGEIIGISEKAYGNLRNNVTGFEMKRFLKLNIFDCIHGLRITTEEHMVNN